MINNSILRADAQVCNNLDVRVKHEHDRKRKMLEHDNIIKQYGHSLLLKCVGYTQYFLSDVYKSGTRGKKQQVDVLQYGRSMIEMLGVLAIVGVLSVGGIAGYSKAMKKFKINKSIDQISHIVANIRTLYAQQTTYEGLNVANAIKMGVTPSEMGTGTTLTNPFNGNVRISSSGVEGPGQRFYDRNKVFSIAYGGIDIETCVILATYDWGDKYSSGLRGIHIGTNVDAYGADIETSYGGGYLYPKRMSPVEAQNACSSIYNTFGVLYFGLTYQ